MLRTMLLNVIVVLEVCILVSIEFCISSLKYEFLGGSGEHRELCAGEITVSSPLPAGSRPASSPSNKALFAFKRK